MEVSGDFVVFKRNLVAFTIDFVFIQMLLCGVMRIHVSNQCLSLGSDHSTNASRGVQ